MGFHFEVLIFLFELVLCVQKMADGAKKLIGDNDYRNLCKMDVVNGVVNFRRTVLSVDLKKCEFKRR